MLSPWDGLLCFGAGFLLAAYFDCKVVRRWFRKHREAKWEAQVAGDMLRSVCDDLRVLVEEGRSRRG